MRSMLVGLALMVTSCAALTGCSGASDNSVEPAIAPEAPVTSTLPPPMPSPSPRDPLADLAEQAASGVPTASLPPAQTGPVLGSDISWPQCPRGLGIPERPTLGLPLPLAEAEYVIVGLTNGPAFYVNPCLAEQAAWVKQQRLLLGAYAVTSYPDEAALTAYADEGPFDADSTLGALSNVGYQQALFNIASMRSSGLGDVPFVWIDVEPVKDFEWSGDPEANAAVVRGVARGYTDADYGIGVYSTPYLWRDVVGDLSLGLPEWRAAGQTSRAEALSRCSDEWVIQGGRGVLGQWVAAERDQNVTCPGVSADMGAYFKQY